MDGHYFKNASNRLERQGVIIYFSIHFERHRVFSPMIVERHFLLSFQWFRVVELIRAILQKSEKHKQQYFKWVSRAWERKRWLRGSLLSSELLDSPCGSQHCTRFADCWTSSSEARVFQPSLCSRRDPCPRPTWRKVDKSWHLKSHIFTQTHALISAISWESASSFSQPSFRLGPSRKTAACVCITFCMRRRRSAVIVEPLLLRSLSMLATEASPAD